MNYENKTGKQLFKFIVLSALGLFVVNTWNNFITTTIEVIYPKQDEEDKRKKVISLFLYSMIITMIFIFFISISNRFFK